MSAGLLLFLLLSQAPAAEQLSAQALRMAQEGRPAEAEKLWLQALQTAPDLFSANFNLGFFYYSAADLAKAEPYLSRAARAQPRDYNARFLYGVVLSRLGKSDDALRQWRDALALRPGSAALMQALAVEYGKGSYFREAAAIAEQALTLSPEPNLYLIAIKSWQDAGEHPRALRVAEKFHARFPALARANFEYGFELYRAGRPEDGIGFVRKAMEIDPSYEEPAYFYGELLLQQGRHQEAVASLRKAIAIRPDYISARVALARCLIALDLQQDALAELRAAVESNPKHPQPHLLLSQLYFRLGDESRAAEEKALSLQLRREDPGAMEAVPGRPFPSTR